MITGHDLAVHIGLLEDYNLQVLQRDGAIVTMKEPSSSGGIVQLLTEIIKGSTLNLTSTRCGTIRWNTVQMQDYNVRHMTSRCHFVCQSFPAASSYSTTFMYCMEELDSSL